YINDAKNKKPEEATCYSREEIFERMVEGSNAQISITAYYKVKNINSLKKRTKYIGQNVSYYPNSVKTFKIIQTCGDIESNPGPKKTSTAEKRRKYPCKECSKPVKCN
ncbi:Hypothetical predicted protein, partial [Paramuricea clavata]